MKSASTLTAAALLGGSLTLPQAAGAQTTIESLGLTVTATPAVTTDYLFRGISQTRGRPAAQFTLDVEHSSGLYIGGFISNVAFPGTNLRQEVDGSFGYRFSLGDLKLDVGATYFGYPGYERPPGGYDWAWWEVNLRASQEVGPFKLLGQVSWSPNFNFESGNAVYVEGGFDLGSTVAGVTLSARAGYQWVEDNARFGLPDYGVFSVGLSREIAFGVIGAVTFSHATVSRSDCFGGLAYCGTRVAATISRPF
jgi:uncharacterized protein (TIGR02001 family)